MGVVIILIGADVVVGDVVFNAVEDHVSFRKIKSIYKYITYMKLPSLSEKNNTKRSSCIFTSQPENKGFFFF